MAKIECSKFPGRKTCDPKADPFELCNAAGTECDPVITKDSCEGTRLVYCDDGYIEKADCTELGFKGCAPLKDKNGVYTLGAICK